jgi:hypothetical protein
MLPITYYGDITGEIAFPDYSYISVLMPDNSAKERICSKLNISLPNNNIS